MQNFYRRILNTLPKKEEIKKAIAHFSKREYFVFLGLLAVLLVSAFMILQNINKSLMVKIPMKGGTVSEGVVGTPRFVNPILAFSEADQDLVSLIYSGLMRKNPDGSLTPDLAEKYEVSKDGLIYTFTLNDKIYFQDEKPVTANDVVFTVNKIKDPLTKSPKKGNWDGISIEKVDEKTVKFTLKQPYASFLENTTLPIMPEHIWKDTPVELNNANIEPVGSGPFKIGGVSKQQGGLVEYYDLLPFKKFNLGKPYLSRLTLRFYQNEDDMLSALGKGEVDQVSSITPLNAKALKEKGFRVESLTLPRVFGLFFNQSQNRLFTDKNIIKAMNLAIDKDGIVREVLLGYGLAIDDPIPPDMLSYQELTGKDGTPYEEKVKRAEEILSKDGWKKNTDGFLEKTVTEKKKKKTSYLEFSISTGNAPELMKTAEMIKKDLEHIGMKVSVKTFEIGNLNQGVIRPRKYDALLFGEIINRESDLFAFWHSSQRKDPGLNVAMYTNAKVDKILENAFVTVDEKARVKKYMEFEEEIRKDLPAIFLYSPDLIYVVSRNLEGFAMDRLTFPSDRFLNSYLWYTETDNVWKIFSK